MKRFKVKLRGVTPLMHHKFGEEELFGLLGSKSSRKKDKEELTPREIADKHAYKTTDGKYYIPAEFVTGAIKTVSTEYKQKNSSKKSLKAIISGVVVPAAPSATLTKNCGTPIDSFEVDVRKATNHQKGAVAVCRPRFDEWNAEIELAVDTELVSADTVHQMLNDAGKRAGIGSFRVARGGYFGQFMVEKFQEVIEQ